MKQIWPLLSLALIAAPLSAPATAEAGPLSVRAGFDGAELVLAGNKKKSRDDDSDNSGSNRQRPADNRGNSRRDDDRRNDDRQPQQERQPQVQQKAQRFDRPQAQENRDDRINRAMSVAGRRGRVLDAGPQGGSVFWVRVATDHGRVDLLVDADSGRIIGER
jgi:hypothetical protein